MELVVKDLLGSRLAVSPEKGEVLYEFLYKNLENKDNIVINFAGIEQHTTAFLNKAFGKLYSNFSSEELNQLIRIDKLDELDKFLLNKVIVRAKLNIDKDLVNHFDEVFEDE